MNDKITFTRTNAGNEDFIGLVEELDTYLSGINGDKDTFFKQFNTINTLQHVVICYLDKIAVGCGAFKIVTDETVEVKRMYVKPKYRGNNIGTLVLKELEKWAKEERFETIILETSKTMEPAVNLYRKNEYAIIPNYEPYKNIESSVCFKKSIGLNILS